MSYKRLIKTIDLKKERGKRLSDASKRGWNVDPILRFSLYYKEIIPFTEFTIPGQSSGEYLIDLDMEDLEYLRNKYFSQVEKEEKQERLERRETLLKQADNLQKQLEGLNKEIEEL